mgnify:CR=1 FL=1
MITVACDAETNHIRILIQERTTGQVSNEKATTESMAVTFDMFGDVRFKRFLRAQRDDLRDNMMEAERREKLDRTLPGWDSVEWDTVLSRHEMTPGVIARMHMRDPFMHFLVEIRNISRAGGMKDDEREFWDDCMPGWDSSNLDAVLSR